MNGTRFSLHVAAHPRTLRHPLALLALGHLPAKTYRVDWAFELVGFSIALSGDGRMAVDGESVELSAPCGRWCASLPPSRCGSTRPARSIGWIGLRRTS